MAKKLPDIDERDRHIAPLSGADVPIEDDEENEEIEDVEELPDGSAVVKLEGDKEPEDDPDFLVNLADVIDETELAKMSSLLTDLIEKDRQARSKRDEKYKEGLRRTGLGDDAPGGAGFDGASKVVHPILAESCIDFESRAIKELFPANGPVKTNIVGKKTEDKLQRADRKAKYLNWQMTKQMSEYRPTLEQILTQVPMGGSQYQAFWWDSAMRRSRTEFVPIDDMLLPFACTDFYSSHRVTRVLHLTEEEINKRINNGMYRDVLDSIPPDVEKTAAGDANDKIEGREADAYNDDGLRDVYEIYANMEFEDDTETQGELAPYIITIDKHTDKVLAVYRNWLKDDPERNKLHWIVEWQFIPWRGAYAVGLPHIIGGLSGAATGALRALLDSAHINNNASLVKLKSGKSSGGNITVEPTQVAEIDAPAGTDDIRKVLMAMPYNQPSPVLFQLLGWLTDAGKGVISTTEESLANVGDRTPVGTTMAMVEQGAATYSAIHARLHYTQARAIEILCRINAQFLDDEVVVEELGELVVSRNDFVNSQDILPVSDPNIFSETQRFAQVQGIAQVKAMFPELAWNNNAIARRMLNRMKVDDIDEILPPEKKPENLNPIGENAAAMQGTPLLALPPQNHLAHIGAHIEFCMDPAFGGPILGAKMLPAMLEHIKQHVTFWYTESMEQAVGFSKRAGDTPTRKLEEEMATAHEEVLQQMAQQMAQIMPALEQIAQKAQQYAPQPPMDPSIQATKEVAMADVQRKRDRDNAELEIQRAEASARDETEKLSQQVELAKNTEDNRQHQITELAKNHEDNMTQQWIAMLDAQQERMMQEMQRRMDVFMQNMQARLDGQKHMVDTAANMHMHEVDQQHAAEQAEADRQHAAEQSDADRQAAADTANTESKPTEE